MVTNLKDLLRIYRSLETSPHSHNFHCISSWAQGTSLLFGKENNSICFYFVANKNIVKNKHSRAIYSKYIIFRHYEKIVVENSKGDSKFLKGDAISFTSNNSQKNELFVIQMWNIINNPEIFLRPSFFIKNIKEIIANLENVKKRSSESREEEIGIYGELLVIFFLFKKWGKNKVLSWWRSSESDRFDFSITRSLKMEVKTTSSEKREHYFSHQQLFAPELEIIVASVFLKENKEGKSLYDFYIEIKSFGWSDEKGENITKKMKILDKKLIELGINSKKKGIKADPDKSLESIKFYDSKDVPHFNCPEPMGVSETSYRVNMENLKEKSIILLLKKKYKHI